MQRESIDDLFVIKSSFLPPTISYTQQIFKITNGNGHPKGSFTNLKIGKI